MRVDLVYRACLAILGDADQASNATRETFRAAWSRISNLKDTDKLDGWLAWLTINACRNELRGLPEGQTAATDMDRFDRAFERLPVEDRAILVLHHLQQRSAPELSLALEIPEEAIKERLYRARTAFGSAMAKESR